MASKMAGRSRVEFPLADPAQDVACAIARGDTRGMRPLVLFAILKFIERQRDGTDIALAGIAHQAKQRPGIHSGGEK